MPHRLELEEVIGLSVLQKCATPNGLFASAPPDGYTMVFSRDAMISLLGAKNYPAPFIKIQFEKSLSTLGKHVSNNGQIPNAVDLFDPKRKQSVSFATVDSTLWWLIGLSSYSEHYKDAHLQKRFSGTIQDAFYWLACQDTGEDGMPEQHPTSDWQDAFPHKYGHTINTQALYYHALNAYGFTKPAKQVFSAVNGQLREDWTLWDDQNGYYLPWRWKNHDQFHEYETWFDSLGNLLAILTNLADKRQALRILEYIQVHHIDSPFPCRAIHPPLEPRTREWHDYFNACAAKKPNEYLNGGIWPYIGALYVLCLVKTNQMDLAHQHLAKLEKSVLIDPRQPFPEWIHPYTQEAFGKDQAWSAGCYLAAKKSVEKKKALFF